MNIREKFGNLERDRVIGAIESHLGVRLRAVGADVRGRAPPVGQRRAQTPSADISLVDAQGGNTSDCV